MRFWLHKYVSICWTSNYMLCVHFIDIVGYSSNMLIIRICEAIVSCSSKFLNINTLIISMGKGLYTSVKPISYYSHFFICVYTMT